MYRTWTIKIVLLNEFTKFYKESKLKLTLCVTIYLRCMQKPQEFCSCLKFMYLRTSVLQTLCDQTPLSWSQFLLSTISWTSSLSEEYIVQDPFPVLPILHSVFLLSFTVVPQIGTSLRNSKLFGCEFLISSLWPWWSIINSLFWNC